MKILQVVSGAYEPSGAELEYPSDEEDEEEDGEVGGFLKDHYSICFNRLPNRLLLPLSLHQLLPHVVLLLRG